MRVEGVPAVAPADGAAAAGGGAAECSGQPEAVAWGVSRRFSQFVRLHDELLCSHAPEVRASGCRLPAKFRLPTLLPTAADLAAEGADRMGPLQAYLDCVVASEALRAAPATRRFLGAD
ncbi:hypothetical protein EMIHUDRAFT_208344 [Emiliania huxleyi CCMP1516]|uniref:PX domain-containing protein n=2 Tax=Emiliania huxleyi TaxID=2903 RepID=A0A0D3JAE1_EMIH1|nr:hypothetical protein EMIHUDRAFT_208344 [Emiliania huxleyi CCMP1516]EOD20476.1 hypothetical protein EMIHUDRAFT_208344 [Emiliania huxleyi CCMP1516]|eukprot:XP_005772905.1 hypothetical protein EMIHUDRAFT_208344 [Emiliania huxleyi CCMP1516]